MITPEASLHSLLQHPNVVKALQDAVRALSQELAAFVFNEDRIIGPMGGNFSWDGSSPVAEDIFFSINVSREEAVSEELDVLIHTVKNMRFLSGKLSVGPNNDVHVHIDPTQRSGKLGEDILSPESASSETNWFVQIEVDSASMLAHLKPLNIPKQFLAP